MAKYANAGEMNTLINIEECSEAPDGAGFLNKKWADVFGGYAVFSKWVNAHGEDLMEAQKLNLKQLATVTVRYSPKITETCRVKKNGDIVPYDIISVDDVENRHVWMELKVARRVKGV